MTDSPVYVQPNESPDYLRCMDYLLYRELGVEEEVDGKKIVRLYTMQEYAERHGISRQSAYKWYAKWEASGLLAMCRDVMSSPLVEEVTIANRRVLKYYPEMVDRMIQVVLRGKYDRDRVEAFKVLQESIVKPQVEARVEVGLEERKYIQLRKDNPDAFDPHALLNDGSDD